MKKHKIKRRKRNTFRQFLFRCWINIKKLFKALLFLVVLSTFLGFGYYIVNVISNREFTVYLALAFVICFVSSYILGDMISKVKDWDFSNAVTNFNGDTGDIGGCLIALILFIAFFLLFGVTYFGANYMIYKITGNKKFKSL